MSRQLKLGLAAIVLCGVRVPAQAQSKSTPAAQVDVESVEAVPQVYVRLRLHTAGQPMFVPYCGGPEGGKVLCVAATHLEVKTKEGWQPAKPRTTFGVLGARSLEYAQGVVIAPGSEAFFIFEFSRRYFKVDPGQQLRVVVDAWPDKQSMKAGGRRAELRSPPFRCPDVGTSR